MDEMTPAQKAAQARSRREHEEQAKERRENIYVYHGGECLDTFPAGVDGLEQAVDELLESFHGTGGRGYDGLDMAVWHDGRLVAVVRAGAGGRPEATFLTDGTELG
jgi:hypothetical protein